MRNNFKNRGPDEGADITHLFSKMTSPPSSATKESKATDVRVRTDPDCELPMVGRLS